MAQNSSETQLERKIRILSLAIQSLTTAQEIACFLRDIATYKEIEGLYERLEVATLLDKGCTYRSIAEQTGASTTTVTRVAHWLHHGKGGYQLVIQRMKK